MDILRTEGLYKTYNEGSENEVHALKPLDISIEEGVFYAIIGRSGSGKSTLMQQLNGLLKPTSGQVLLDGVDIWKDKATTRRSRFRVGLVFQYPEYQLFEETVYKDIAFGPKNMGLDQKEIEERVGMAADFVGLDRELLDKSPFDLSGGQKRRAAIAGIIAMRPDVLVLAEPAAGLDPAGREEILGFAKKLRDENGITVILVSHSMEDVAEYVDRIIVMNRGQVAFDGVPKEVFRHHKELETMGLAAPQVTYIVEALRAKGFPIGEDITTVEEAKAAILQVVGGKR